MGSSGGGTGEQEEANLQGRIQGAWRAMITSGCFGEVSMRGGVLCGVLEKGHLYGEREGCAHLRALF